MWGESSAKQNQMWFAGFLSKPNREECSAQASLSESVCVRVCVWWGEGVRRSRSSLLGWDNTKSNCSREVARQAGRGSLQPGWRQGQQGVRCVCCGGGGKGRGGGGEIGHTAGGVIVLPDSQSEYMKSLNFAGLSLQNLYRSQSDQEGD